MSRSQRFLRDPVVHFVVLGALIFGVHAFLDRDSSDEPIVVSSRFVRGLEAEYRERFGRAPSPSESEELVRRHVREEALVREARRLGLDRTDPIVRRRLAQKMELTLRGGLALPRPTDDELRAWIAANPDAVATDERVSFRQAFVSVDLRGDAARAAADAIAAEVRTSADPAATVVTKGDSFAFGTSFDRSSTTALDERLGREVRDAILACAPGTVCGPVESRYGLHVVVVTAREPAGSLPFATARPIAERALLRAREDRALDQAIDALVAEHGVERIRDRGDR